MNDIWFYEAFEEEAEAIRAFLPDGLRVGFCAETLAESGHEAPPAPLISTRTQSFVPDNWHTKLGAVLSRSTGFDHLLALRQAGFRGDLGHLPLYCHRAVAEHALLMILALARKLPLQQDNFRRFERDGLTGREIRGRRVAIFGVGNIGSELANMLHALGMDVVGVDPAGKPGPPRADRDEALATADVVVCAMDLNEGNVDYFDLQTLRRVRPGTLFVNVSRGELSRSTVLLQLLEEGHLGGVALDVYDSEKTLALPLRSGKAPTHPEAVAALALSRRTDAICTPHNAFNSTEAVQRKAEQAVEQAVAWTSTRSFIWSVPE